MPFQNPKLTRRALLPLIGVIALPASFFALLAARAQGGGHWQIYRRADLGFEIEMPGKPEIREDRLDGLTSIEAAVDVDQMRFGVGYQEYEKAMTVQQMAAAQRLVAQTIGSTVSREAVIAMNGFPGLDVVMESKLLSMAMRVVLMPERKRSISAMVSGHGRLSENASVRRFLDSFKLVP